MAHHSADPTRDFVWAAALALFTSREGIAVSDIAFEPGTAGATLTRYFEQLGVDLPRALDRGSDWAHRMKNEQAPPLSPRGEQEPPQ